MARSESRKRKFGKQETRRGSGLSLTVLQGDCLEQLRTLPDASVQCCVTSPPYWGLRDYGVAGQLGLEKTPEEYVAKMVAVFHEVRRVLMDAGTCWVNLGDSYAASEGQRKATDAAGSPKQVSNAGSIRVGSRCAAGLKPKDLVGIPWMTAFALRADGWYLRQDIIWSKPNPMPESVQDRCTKAHEYIFMLSKRARYFYAAEAIREKPAREWWNEPRTEPGNPDRNDGGGVQSRPRRTDKQRGHSRRHDGFNDRWDAMEKSEQQINGANKRSVWNIATNPYAEAHFATFPPALIKPCILAGSKPGDTVLDPFGGSGTTGMVALELGRKALLIELNPDYIKLIHQRCDVTPGLPLETAQAA
jgi:DNA modification methylase